MQQLGVRWRAVVLAVVTLMTAMTASTTPVSAAQGDANLTIGVGTSVVSGLFHTCVLMQDSSVKCWGSNENGQIGQNGVTGSQALAFNPSPVEAYSAGLGTAVSVATGGRHSCALRSNGTVACWGKNDYGQLGLSLATPDTQTPTEVAGLNTVTSISAGDVFTCATKANGTAWCWGIAANGQLGRTTVGLPTKTETPVPPAVVGAETPYSSTPVQVAGLTDAIAVDTGNNHACALKTDGTVWCWGDNAVGQLGRGTMADGSSFVATPVSGLDRVANLTSGRAHSCARKTSGAVFCWGANDVGQLGVGNNGPKTTPEVIPTLGAVRNISAAEDTTCVVRNTGTAACWGSNSDGQLGDGTTNNSYFPSTVSGLTSAVIIAPGWRHTCALLTSGSMMCWGANDRGQLGRGTGGQPTDPDALVPGVVPGLTAVQLDAGTVVNPGPTPAPVVTDQPYVSLAAPERVLDTRPGVQDVIDGNAAYQGTGPIVGTKSVVIPGRGTTPSGIASVFLNVTVVAAPQSGYLTVYPCSASQPTASNVNFQAGDTVANAVVTKVGSGNDVCVFASSPVNVIVDVAGYFPTTSSFTPLAAPIRILETRPGADPTIDGQAYLNGKLPDGRITRLAIAGRNGGALPNTISSVVLNVTAIEGGDNGGYLTVWPCDAVQPNASNVNFGAGQTIPNLVISKVSNTGEICIYNFRGVHLAIDAAGYFATAVSYSPLAAPIRLMDIRDGGQTIDNVAAGKTAGSITGNGPSYELVVGGRGGISSSAGAVLANVTVTNPQADGYLTVYPCGQLLPTVSNINFKAGQTIANSVPAGIGAGRKICIFSSATADVVVDVAGTLS